MSCKTELYYVIFRFVYSEDPQSTQDMEQFLFALPKLEVTFKKKQNKVTNVLLLYWRDTVIDSNWLFKTSQLEIS